MEEKTDTVYGDTTHSDVALRKGQFQADESGQRVGPTQAENNEANVEYPSGIRFWVICASLAVSLFLTNMEIPIVTTALVDISDDLGDFSKVGWVITSYLFGYVGVLVIFAKMSDILGRRAMLSLSLFIFIVWSGACGAAQTMNQLIVFRAFQGIGGGGNFGIATALMTELGPPEKLSLYAANLSTVYAFSLILGPILGGAISSNTTWRWVFLLNVPAAVPALLAAIFAIPSGFTYQSQLPSQCRNLSFLAAKSTRNRLDIVGATLLLLATLSLTAGFEEAGSRFPWRSAYVIALLVVSGFLWVFLLFWERHITQNSQTVEPVLPWRFLQNRAVIALLLNSVFLGGPWFVAIFQLPQKFQLVHGLSGLDAGLRLVPFTGAGPLGSFAGAIAAKKFRVPAMYIILCSAAFQTLGFGLLASLPKGSVIPSRIYGYEVIAGFGCGMNINLLLLTIPFTVEVRDKAVGMAAVSQLRPMGGAIILAIATSVFNGYVQPRIRTFDLQSSMTLSGESVAQLPPTERENVRSVLSQAYNLQMIVLCAFAAVQIPTTLLMYRRKQIMV